ncbi:MAG: hydroxymethylbilane synthase [Actinomycetota bacterium]|nr:hydroxymethylbilane synthase [Actinomycetota bacterium]
MAPAASPMAPVRLATRPSALALFQAHVVGDLLARAVPGIAVEIIEVTTLGDRQMDASIAELGGQGIFVKEVQAAVLEGRADAAVHSAKDLPSSPEGSVPGLCLAAVPARADVRDALIGASLEAMAPGATIATGAPRRRAQLAWLRPDLTFCELRGNVGSRISKVPRGGAVVVAVAALDRLGRRAEATEILATSMMVPQVGQGALAVECRSGDHALRSMLARIEDRPARVAVDAERAFLAALGGGCDLPVGGYAHHDASGRIVLDGLVAAPDGSVVVRRSSQGDDPLQIGGDLAVELLDACGGSELLDRFSASPARRGHGAGDERA